MNFLWISLLCLKIFFRFFLVCSFSVSCFLTYFCSCFLYKNLASTFSQSHLIYLSLSVSLFLYLCVSLSLSLPHHFHLPFPLYYIAINPASLLFFSLSFTFPAVFSPLSPLPSPLSLLHLLYCLLPSLSFAFSTVFSPFSSLPSLLSSPLSLHCVFLSCLLTFALHFSHRFYCLFSSQVEEVLSLQFLSITPLLS